MTGRKKKSNFRKIWYSPTKIKILRSSFPPHLGLDMRIKEQPRANTYSIPHMHTMPKGKNRWYTSHAHKLSTDRIASRQQR